MQKYEIEEIILVGGSTSIPKIQQLIKEFFDGKEIYKSSLDEAMVFGAAVQAGIISGKY